MPDRYKVYFPDTTYPPIDLAAHQNLSEHLTIRDSPVLFGCRTGICGTCLVEVRGEIAPPAADELEVLNLIAPDRPQARLACQIALTADVQIWRLET